MHFKVFCVYWPLSREKTDKKGTFFSRNIVWYYNDLLSRWLPVREVVRGHKLTLQQIKDVLGK